MLLTCSCQISHFDQEHLRTVLLDTRKSCAGNLDRLHRQPQHFPHNSRGKVFKEAVRRNSAALIVAHDHPSGDATPSPRRHPGDARSVSGWQAA